MQHAIGRARRKAFEFLVQLARAEQRQHHDLIEIGAAALDADLPADGGMAAVAADHVVGFEDFLGAVFGDGDARAACVLLDGLGGPAEPRLDTAELRHPLAQHVLDQILRQPLVRLEVIGIDDLAQRRRIPVFVVEVAIGDDAAHRKFRRQHAYRAHLVGDAPGMKMLHRALGQVLTLGNELRLEPALDQRAGYAAQPELHRERDADGTAADNDDLIPLTHGPICLLGCIIRPAAPAEPDRAFPARAARY